MAVSRQLNLRLDDQDAETLEALAYVRRTSESLLARVIVIEYLVAHADEPGLKEALAARARRDAAANAVKTGRKLHAVARSEDETADSVEFHEESGITPGEPRPPKTARTRPS